MRPSLRLMPEMLRLARRCVARPRQPHLIRRYLMFPSFKRLARSRRVLALALGLTGGCLVDVTPARADCQQVPGVVAEEGLDGVLIGRGQMTEAVDPGVSDAKDAKAERTQRTLPLLPERVEHESESGVVLVRIEIWELTTTTGTG